VSCCDVIDRIKAPVNATRTRVLSRLKFTWSFSGPPSDGSSASSTDDTSAAVQVVSDQIRLWHAETRRVRNTAAVLYGTFESEVLKNSPSTRRYLHLTACRSAAVSACGIRTSAGRRCPTGLCFSRMHRQRLCWRVPSASPSVCQPGVLRCPLSAVHACASPMPPGVTSSRNRCACRKFTGRLLHSLQRGAGCCGRPRAVRSGAALPSSLMLLLRFSLHSCASSRARFAV